MDIAPKYIIAGSYNQYRLYIRDRQLDGIQYIFVSNVNSIRGLNDISGEFIGTWNDRDDIVDIIAEICNIKSRISDWDMPPGLRNVYNSKLFEKYDISFKDISVPNTTIVGKNVTSIWMDELMSNSRPYVDGE